MPFSLAEQVWVVDDIPSFLLTLMKEKPYLGDVVELCDAALQRVLGLAYILDLYLVNVSQHPYL